jgi:DNA-directed RNA polymerase specialized sigma24 family protein
MVDNPHGDLGANSTKAADEALLEFLSSVDFQGPAWDRLAQELARYALPIIRSWIQSMKIFRKCAEKNVRCFGPPQDIRRLTDDDASEMTNEIIARALNNFREKVLRPQAWSSQGGARLSTMFINQCLFQFPNVYRHWLLETQRAPIDDLEDLEFVEAGPGNDPAGLVLIRNEVAHALEHYVRDENVRRALVLKSLGYTIRESAELIGMTEKALDSALRRHWKTTRHERPHGDEEGNPVP